MIHVVKLFGVAFFAAFTGLLLGMSSSPVLGAIVGALAASIAAILGILKKDELRMSVSDYLSVGAFGLFGMVGVLSGLELRTGKIINNNLLQKQEKWLQVVRDSSLVQTILIFEETGLVIDKDVKVDNREGALATRSVVLFSVDASVADKLDPENFQDPNDVFQAWTAEGEPWNVYADRIARSFKENEQMDKYKTVWKILKD